MTRVPEPTPVDCIVIGYNDPPFAQYENLLRGYGEDSVAYRDLRMSMVDLTGEKLNYPDLMNQVLARAGSPLSIVSGEIPNLAAAYLTNFLRRQGHRATYVNLFQREKERFAELLAENPICVAITTTFYILNFPVNEIVDFVRQNNPRVKVIVGGPLVANHVRNYQGEGLQSVLLDIGADVYIQESQGEATLARLVGCLKGGGNLEEVPNLLYRDSGTYRRTEVEPENNNLDACDIDWLALSGADIGTTLQARTARSCAFKCAFCNYPTRAGKLTTASLGTIERELDSMHARGNVKNVVFIDDTFNVPLPRFKEICRLLIRKRYGFNWFSYFRCSNSDDEAIELAVESGCRGVFLGIESGSPTILENMNKAATIEKYADGINRLARHGVITFGSFILGFPGETDRTVKETLDFVLGNPLDYYRIQVWYNEFGTPVHRQQEKYGIEGDGFVWQHASMDSMEAMDHIERLFLTIRGPQWLPQWSFDFWIIPYLLGKGISRERFHGFMSGANELLRLEIAAVEPREKQRRQEDQLGRLVDATRSWSAPS